MSAPANDHVAPLVDDYVHDLLAPAEADRVERHCRDCAGCAKALEHARRRLSVLRAMPPTEATAELVQTTLDRVEDEAEHGGGLRRQVGVSMLVAFAAAALFLVGAQIYYANLKPDEVDLLVLGQRELLAATRASLRVRVSAFQGRLLFANIPVVVTLRAPDGTVQEVGRATTDDQGTAAPTIELPDWADGTYQLEVTARTLKRTETLTRPVRLKRSWKLMLSSDKPVYQPGQKVLLRSLALSRPDLKPVAGQQAVFTLADPRGNVLFKHTQPTSKFGLASAECELAHEIQEGPYTVVCRVEGVESRLTVEVRRYVLPKFKLALTPDRPYYAPGSRASIRVQADYFFGKPVSDGRLDFEVVSKAGQLIAKGNAKVGAEGSARLDIEIPKSLPGRPNDQGDARLVAVAELTDSAGQKQSVSAEVLVTAQPIRVQALPEAGQLVRGVTNTVYLLVTRADGAPVPGVTIRINGEGVEAEAIADERGAASFHVTPQGSEIAWTLNVTDAGGEMLVRRSDRIPVGTMQGDFLVRLDRAGYKAGQTVTLTALGGGVEPVFLDLVKDGQTMLSQQIELTDGKGELAIDLPSDLFGTVQLIAYRFVGTHGLPVRKARVLYIAPPTGLRIRVTLDQGEYRPGKEALINLRLLDEKGRPTPGAISLSAVDEAVFSVLSQKPGMEQAFYTLEQELLKPVYAIYPWQPDEAGPVAERDRALFTATARGLDTPPSPNLRLMTSPQVAEAGPHTLAVRSTPIKEEATRMLKHRRLDMVKRGWLLFLLTAVLCGYATMWMFVSVENMLKIHAIGGVAMMFLALVFFFLGAAPMASFMGGKSSFADAAPMSESTASRSGRSPQKRSGAMAMPRVRRHFPETLLWKPELITDDEGRLQPLKVPLADSITTWRLSASAVGADGRLGATQLPIKVFQPFFVDLNLPVSLTRGDEIGMPVVVYNYLDRPQTVTLNLTESPWFALDGKATQKVELAAGEVRSTRFTLKVTQVGSHTLKVTALAGPVGDAIERTIEVIPDGKRVEFALSGSLGTPAEHTLDVPANVIEGSVKAFVKVYPTGFSQLVEGLENIFRLPSGCFEQTSSTTYPNILALDYLRRNKLSAPQIEAKARQYIHLGYQRLVAFEVPGGGFDWYGRPPANVPLTAYGLMEFVDMAKVHDVDPRLIERTRTWLWQKRRPDGSWDPEGRGAHFAAAHDQQSARLATTAYIAWAIFSSGQAGLLDATVTLHWLLTHKPNDIKDPHTLALLCNALLAIDPNADTEYLSPYLGRLAELAKRSDDGKSVHWAQDAGQRTTFYGAGVSGQVETTALATLALLQAKRHLDLTRGALAWLASKKDPSGTWHSTQATVLALKALLAGTAAGGEEKERRITLQAGKHAEQIVIPADQAEVLKLVEVTRHLAPGANRLRLAEQSKSGAGYQVVFRYHVPASKPPAKPAPLDITIAYDRTELAVGGAVKAKATVVNQQDVTAPMVMLDLPVPPGFAPDAEEFAAQVEKRAIARFQVLPRSVLVYVRGLEPGAKLTLDYTLRATMPVRVAAPGGRVYEYYDPQKQGTSPATRFVVKPGE